MSHPFPHVRKSLFGIILIRLYQLIKNKLKILFDQRSPPLYFFPRMETTTTTTTGTENSAVRLTELETKAMRVLFDSADGNGHDFGFIDDLIDARIMGRDQVSGVVSSLAKKGVIFNWGTETNTNGWGVGSYTQFTWGTQCGDGPEKWESHPETLSQFFTMFNILPALVSFEGLRQGA